MDETLTDHENIIGVYNVDIIDARTLISVIHDVLLRMTLKMSQWCGQCYDGAANMMDAIMVLLPDFSPRSRVLFKLTATVTPSILRLMMQLSNLKCAVTLCTLHLR